MSTTALTPATLNYRSSTVMLGILTTILFVWMATEVTLPMHRAFHGAMAMVVLITSGPLFYVRRFGPQNNPHSSACDTDAGKAIARTLMHCVGVFMIALPTAILYMNIFTLVSEGSPPTAVQVTGYIVGWIIYSLATATGLYAYVHTVWPQTMVSQARYAAELC